MAKREQAASKRVLSNDGYMKSGRANLPKRLYAIKLKPRIGAERVYKTLCRRLPSCVVPEMAFCIDYALHYALGLGLGFVLKDWFHATVPIHHFRGVKNAKKLKSNYKFIDRVIENGVDFYNNKNIKRRRIFELGKFIKE